MSILEKPDINDLTRSAKRYTDTRMKYGIEKKNDDDREYYHVVKQKRLFIIGPYVWMRYRYKKHHIFSLLESLFGSDDFTFSLSGSDALKYTLKGAEEEINHLVLKDLGESSEFNNAFGVHVLRLTNDDGYIDAILD